MFTVPVAGCVVEWVGRCRYTLRETVDSAAVGYSGSIVCRSLDDVRLEPLPDYVSADEYYGSATDGLWIEVRARAGGKPMVLDAVSGKAREFDHAFIGECYGANSSFRKFHRCWRSGRRSSTERRKINDVSNPALPRNFMLINTKTNTTDTVNDRRHI